MSKDWARHRDEIRTLYVAKGKSLEEVRRILKGRHGFDASTRAYRMRLEEWGVKKNKSGGESTVSDRSSKRSARRGAFDDAASPKQGKGVNHISGSSENTRAGDLNSNSAPSFSVNNPLILTNFHSDTQVDLSVNAPSTDLMISGSNFPALNLFDAIWQGSEEVINNLLSSGASVRTRDHLNQSPLHAAIMKGDISIVEALLRYGASIDDQGVGGRSSLHLGIGSKALVKLLLKYHPKESSLQDDDGNTALHLLLRQDAWWTDEDLKATIRCFVSARADINITNKFGESPLHRLVLDAQDVPSIQILLEFLNCSPNMEQPMPNGSLVFDYFLETANEIITSDGGYLLSGKINAVFLCLSRFVEAGADPNTIFHGTPLLSYCLEEYHFGKYWSSGSIFSNFLSLLVQRADLGKAGRADNPPLHSALARELREASSYGRPKFQIIKSLISKKVDVNEVGAQGSSPLEVWIRKAPGRYVIEGVQLLVAAGAVTMRMTSTGNTLFDLVDTRTGRLSKPDGVHLTKLFLEADMKSQQPLEASMSDQYWIEIWRAACKEKRWALLVCHLTRLRESPSRPSVRYFDDCAFLVLANDRLQLHQSQIKLWQAGELDQESAWRHRREYVAILRDCRERKAAIDGSWYQYLLDIMDIQ